MFSAFKKFGKLGALASSVARAWSPLALWPDGIASPGMWNSPPALAASWADYTGTTPVDVPGTVADSANPVGLALWCMGKRQNSPLDHPAFARYSNSMTVESW